MSPTTNQLVKHGRKKKVRKSKSPNLEGRPQLRGTVLSTYVRDPKKPNSADRKVCRVRLSTRKTVVAYIPGEGHMIAEHAQVLIQGGRVPDLSGVNYKVIRAAKNSDDPGEVRKGFHDHEPMSGDTGGWTRKNRRSKYGVKKPK